MELARFGVNMAGCRYEVQPCDAMTPGAERVIRSEAGRLLTEKHDLQNPFILCVSSDFVLVTPLQ